MTIINDLGALRGPAWADVRDQMIHACALQEHIIASGPVLPTSVRIDQIAIRTVGSQRSDVTVYLHRNTIGVEAHQEFLGGDLRREPHPLEDGTEGVMVSLTGWAYGCSFRVWTLAPVTLASIGVAA